MKFEYPMINIYNFATEDILTTSGASSGTNKAAATSAVKGYLGSESVGDEKIFEFVISA